MLENLWIHFFLIDEFHCAHFARFLERNRSKKSVYDDLAEANHAVATATQRVLQPDIIVDGGHGLAVPLGAETLHQKLDDGEDAHP